MMAFEIKNLELKKAALRLLDSMPKGGMTIDTWVIELVNACPGATYEQARAVVKQITDPDDPTWHQEIYVVDPTWRARWLLVHGRAPNQEHREARAAELERELNYLKRRQERAPKPNDAC
jgi:hypothetical protein